MLPPPHQTVPAKLPATPMHLPHAILVCTSAPESYHSLPALVLEDELVVHKKKMSFLPWLMFHDFFSCSSVLFIYLFQIFFAFLWPKILLCCFSNSVLNVVFLIQYKSGSKKKTKNMNVVHISLFTPEG